MLQKKKLSHTTVPDTSFQSLTEFCVNSSAAVLSATEDTFPFVWQYPFVLCNSKHPTYNEGSLLLFEKKL